MDFKELPEDGQAFEQLVRELLFSLGLHVHWSGKGPDGGRDLICRETLKGVFSPQTKTWLVQCKHKAHGGGSVGVNDLDEIVDSCHQHGATGYLLACTTQPSSAVIDRLEAITRSTANDIEATYWDAITLERMLSTSGQWAIAQQFLPVSCGDWKLYATDAPNDFVAHYKGYVFHLSNRIGSRAEHHLSSVRNRIADLEALDMPKGHSVRPRCVWRNDKSAEYVWYIDYMYPHDKEPAWSAHGLKKALHEDWALEDGQIYHWDIKFVKYMPFSDHYDEDHYDYYTKYIPNFLTGSPREERDWEEYYATQQEIEKMEAEASANRDMAFDKMVACFEQVPYLHVMRSVNASPHCIRKMERRYDWSSVVQSLGATPEHLFSTKLIVAVQDDKAFHKLITSLPQGEGGFFRLARVHVYTPDGISSDKDELIYDLELTVFPEQLCNEFEARKAFDAYFNSISAVLKSI